MPGAGGGKRGTYRLIAGVGIPPLMAVGEGGAGGSGGEGGAEVVGMVEMLWTGQGPV